MSCNPEDYTFMVVCEGYKDMRQFSGREKDRFQRGERVIVHGLSMKRKWNRKYATIIGPYQQTTDRWPIKMISTKEKALVRTKNLIATDIQFKEFKDMEESYVHMIAAPLRIDITRCGYCLKQGRLKRCRNCFEYTKTNEYITRYCSRSCQKKHWEDHKERCGYLYPPRQ